MGDTPEGMELSAFRDGAVRNMCVRTVLAVFRIVSVDYAGCMSCAGAIVSYMEVIRFR